MTFLNFAHLVSVLCLVIDFWSLVGCFEAGVAFGIFVVVFLPLPLHCAAKAGSHVLAVFSLAVLCGTYGPRTLMLVNDLWK